MTLWFYYVNYYKKLRLTDRIETELITHYKKKTVKGLSPIAVIRFDKIMSLCQTPHCNGINFKVWYCRRIHIIVCTYKQLFSSGDFEPRIAS